MTTNWLMSCEKDLCSVFAAIENRHPNESVSFIEAAAIIADKGAFVIIDSEDSAKKL